MPAPRPDGHIPHSLVRWSWAVVLAALITLAGLLAWHSQGGLDIWFHDLVGSEILAGRFPDGHNTYSYTQPEHPWTNHEWLFQVLVAVTGPDPEASWAPGVARWNVLRLILALTLACVLFLGDGLLGRVHRAPRLSASLPWLGLPLTLGLMLLWPRLLLRPELLSSLFFVLMVRTLDRPLSRWVTPGRPLSLLDPRLPVGRAFWLTVLWGQIHGFSALGPTLFLLAVLSAWRPRRDASVPFSGPGRLWLLGFPLLLLALCLNPHGVEGLLYPLRALGQFRQADVDLRQTISELVPLLDSPGSLSLTIRAYQISLVWGVLWIILTWGRTSPFRIGLWLIAAFAAFLAQRNLGLYGVAFVLLHTGTMGAPFFDRLAARVPRVPPIPLAVTGAVLTLTWIALWSSQLISDSFYLHEGVSRRFGSGVTAARYPGTAAKMLAGRQRPPVFTNVDGAAFLMNRARVPVFIDGRTEAYSADHWARYQRIKQGDAAAVDQLTRSRAQAIFLNLGSGAFEQLAKSLLSASGWQLAHWDETGLLFYRADQEVAPDPWSRLAHRLPHPDTSQPSARAADLCLAWARIAEIAGDAQARETALQRGLAFRPDHPTLLHNLGNLEMGRHHWAGALAHFEKALEGNPRLGGSALNAGVCLLRLDRGPEAVARFDQATRIDPKNFQGWANLGLAHLSSGDRQAARKALQRALVLRPDDPRLRQLLLQTGRP